VKKVRLLELRYVGGENLLKFASDMKSVRKFLIVLIP